MFPVNQIFTVQKDKTQKYCITGIIVEQKGMNLALLRC